MACMSDISRVFNVASQTDVENYGQQVHNKHQKMRRSQLLASWNKLYFFEEAHSEALRFREKPLHAKSPHGTNLVNVTIDPENRPLDVVVERTALCFRDYP